MMNWKDLAIPLFFGITVFVLGFGGLLIAAIIMCRDLGISPWPFIAVALILSLYMTYRISMNFLRPEKKGPEPGEGDRDQGEGANGA